jgi:hypothetical protein
MRRVVAAALMGALLVGGAPAGTAHAWESPKIRARITQWKAWWVPKPKIWRSTGWVRIRNKTDVVQAISCRVNLFARSGRRVGTQQVSKLLRARRAGGKKFDISGPYGGSKRGKKPVRARIRRCWIL